MWRKLVGTKSVKRWSSPSQLWTRSIDVVPNLAEFWRNETRTSVNESSIPIYMWPTSNEFAPHLVIHRAKFGRFRTRLGRCRSNAQECGRRGPGIGGIPPHSAQIRPKSVQCRASLADLDRDCPEIGKLGLALRIGQSSVWPFSALFCARSEVRHRRRGRQAYRSGRKGGRRRKRAANIGVRVSRRDAASRGQGVQNRTMASWASDPPHRCTTDVPPMHLDAPTMHHPLKAADGGSENSNTERHNTDVPPM